VALFGGPMFAILKALTAIKRADALTKSGTDCVPIFWLATEDHDLAEVSSVKLLDQAGGLRDFSIVPKSDGAPVGRVKLGADVEKLVTEAAGLFVEAEAAALLRDCYKGTETFGSNRAAEPPLRPQRKG